MLPNKIGPDPVCPDILIIIRVQLRPDPVPADAKYYRDNGASRKVECSEIQSCEPGTFKIGLHGLDECVYGLPRYNLVRRFEHQTEASKRKVTLC